MYGLEETNARGVEGVITVKTSDKPYLIADQEVLFIALKLKDGRRYALKLLPCQIPTADEPMPDNSPWVRLEEAQPIPKDCLMTYAAGLLTVELHADKLSKINDEETGKWGAL